MQLCVSSRWRMAVSLGDGAHKTPTQSSEWLLKLRMLSQLLKRRAVCFKSFKTSAIGLNTTIHLVNVALNMQSFEPLPGCEAKALMQRLSAKSQSMQTKCKR